MKWGGCSMKCLVWLLVLLLCYLQAVDSQETTTSEENTASQETEEEEGYFSTLDYILLAAVAAVGGYYLLIKDNAEDKLPAYEIKPMTVSVAAPVDKGFISKLRKTKRRLVVFYGSQTGTAEEFAGRLAKEGARYGLKGLVADPEEEDMDQLQQLKEYEEEIGEACLAVFMMATYGEGDPTDNAMDFNDKLDNDAFTLDGLRYSVFGLGNTTYEHFNAMGIKVDKKLAELGGSRIYQLGLGDDDKNLEDDFITWKESFWAAVCNELNIEASSDEFNTRQYEHKVLEEGDYNSEKVYTGEVARLRSYITQRPPFDVKNPYMSTIKVNDNIHKEGSGRHCMHIELDIEGSRMRYDAGDHVAIYPTNNVQIVDKLISQLGINGETIFTMKNLDEDSTKKHPFPCPTSYRTALLHYVDIVALPRTHILKELAKYTEDNKERSQLELMAGTTPEGKALYQSWIVSDVRHLLHILEDLPTCKPPVDHLLELLPRLQPRFYSIASSAKVHATSVHVCGVVVEYTTPTGRTNKGVATTWLKEKIPGENEYKVPIYIRRSQFRLPNRPQTPVIMIGPGTGLAPFRGFIQERAYLKEQGKPVGPTVLFFGCRNKAYDYIYQDELEQWQTDGVLDLHVAFSRDQEKKRYVTHLLNENGQHVWELLEQGGHLYVCGDAKMMAKDVRNIIVDIAKVNGNMSESEADAFVKKLETQKRYSADVWS